MGETTPNNELDVRTRANLAYIWTAAVIVFIGYILFTFGSSKEILTLIIGFITGTAATILAVYFGAPIVAKKPDVPPTVLNTGDAPTTTVNPTTNNDTPVT